MQPDRDRRDSVADAAAHAQVEVAWLAAVRPSNERSWIAGQERAPHVTFAGDIATIENVRHADWRGATGRAMDRQGRRTGWLR